MKNNKTLKTILLPIVLVLIAVVSYMEVLPLVKISMIKNTVYTDMKDIGKYRLRHYSYFKQNHKNGLRRAMTIVARKALEERGYFLSNSISEQKEKIIYSRKYEDCIERDVWFLKK